eukprot:TRINITY_DN5219_c0_g1_i1.p1 TRINITY_DN5219_c0_g1~~TRINITY_DN5219_c0_g1_i1.p1  ORF type:complete len:242 (+),score=48.60 TRINITY_DN5219_c0_g1_i1:92-817(+)
MKPVLAVVVLVLIASSVQVYGAEKKSFFNSLLESTQVKELTSHLKSIKDLFHNFERGGTVTKIRHPVIKPENAALKKSEKVEDTPYEVAVEEPAVLFEEAYIPDGGNQQRQLELEQFFYESMVMEEQIHRMLQFFDEIVEKQGRDDVPEQEAADQSPDQPADQPTAHFLPVEANSVAQSALPPCMELLVREHGSELFLVVDPMPMTLLDFSIRCNTEECQKCLFDFWLSSQSQAEARGGCH